MPLPSFPFNRPQLYAFDPKTGEYLGTATAEVDHAALARNVVAFLEPAFTTAVEPPLPVVGEASVWDGSAWAAVPDRRGERWFRGEFAAVIDFIGDPAEQGLSPSPPEAASMPEPDPLQIRKQDLLAKISELAQVGAGHVAITSPVPQYIKDEMAAASDELKKINDALSKKKD